MAGRILYTVVVSTGLALLWFVAWRHLADKLMETKTPPPHFRRFLYLAVPLLVALNVALLWPMGYTVLFERLHWSLTIFTFFGAMMVVLLYRGAGLSRAIAAVALSYFFLYTVTITVEALSNYTILRAIWQTGWPEGITLLAQDGVVLLQHTLALGISVLLGRLFDKTRFAAYFGNLFARPGRGWAACGVCLALMHAADITFLLFPALEYHVESYVLAGLADLLVLFLVLFVAVFESNREKVKAQESFIVQQQVYVQTLEGLQKELRAFRHDYQNLLSGLYLQASEGDTEAIRGTLQKTLGYFDERLGGQIHQVTELARVKIPQVKSLLLVKLLRAEELDVPLELEIVGEVERVDMSLGDFLRCLGILVDNALEAHTAGQGGPVRVALLAGERDLALVVANPCATPPDLGRLGQAGYSTKGEGRGTGLASYRKIIGRYHNVTAATGVEDGIFRQELRVWRQK